MASEPTLPITELSRRCAEQMARYQRRQPHSPVYCFEVFRRALEQRDQDAWTAIYNQYYRLIRYQLHGAPGDLDALVNQVFERFWRAIPPERFADFSSLDKLLAYLKCCAQSVALDARRRQERRQVYESALVTLQGGTNPGTGGAPADNLLNEIVGTEVFEYVRKCLSGHQERIVFRASLEWDLKPATIAERWPDLFANAREVSRIKERIFRRLQRDEKLRALLGIGDGDGGEG